MRGSFKSRLSNCLLQNHSVVQSGSHSATNRGWSPADCFYISRKIPCTCVDTLTREPGRIGCTLVSQNSGSGTLRQGRLARKICLRTEEALPDILLLFPGYRKEIFGLLARFTTCIEEAAFTRQHGIQIVPGIKLLTRLYKV